MLKKKLPVRSTYIKVIFFLKIIWHPFSKVSRILDIPYLIGKNSKNEFKRQLKSHCNVQKMLAALLNMHIFMTI